MSLLDDTSSKHRRVYKACVSCRQRKVKCDLGLVDAPHDPPCARCRRENRECYFDAKKPKGSTDGQLEDLSVHSKRRKTSHSIDIQDTQSVGDEMLNQRPTVEAVASSGRGISVQQLNSLQAVDDEQEGATPNDDGAYTSNATLNLLYTRATHNEDQEITPQSFQEPRMQQNPTSVNHASTTAGSASPAVHDIWSRFVMIQDGLFSVDEALIYMRFYKDHLDSMTPISSARLLEPEAHHELLTQEPVLTVAILTITSRFCSLPGLGSLSRRYLIHERLWQFLQQMLSRIFWAEDEPSTSKSDIQLRSIGTCEALLLLTEWHNRAVHFPPGREGLRILVGEIHPPRKNQVVSGDPSAWMEWSWRSDRLTWSMIWTAFGLACELDVFGSVDETANSRRKSDAGMQRSRQSASNPRACRLRQLLMVSMTLTSSRTGHSCPLPDALLARPTTQLDAVTKLWTDISNLTRKIHETLFVSAGHIHEIIQNGSYVGLLYLLAPNLHEFRASLQTAEVPAPMRMILAIEYDHIRAHMNSIALQALGKKDKNQVLVMQNSNDPFVAETIEGARSVLWTVVNELCPMEALKFIPVRTYYRILTAVVFLIKAIKITNSPTEAEVSCALIEQVGVNLKGSIQDDSNLAGRWGQMIIDLSAKERQMFARRQSATTSEIAKGTFTPSMIPNGMQSDTSTSPSEFFSIGNPQTWVSFPLGLENEYGYFNTSFWGQDPMPGQFM